ncbi:site-specific tyrosine recombinase/integron integrase [uncultured Prevotella sp.]|uniref:site-specific tyrosine recombinase/integron integrase n=1 Tax=uncultured Prevotella sp. TaxID=159272 RepID=UPI0025D30603|nr:site-specific tyrosine recombinase/integron integrase [uncultured Prevotella sp.]
MQNDDLSVLRRRYVRYLRLERGYSDNTIEAYTHDIDYLLNYLRNENLKVEDVKLDNLENFAAVIYEFGIASSSQARILCGVRSFFKYLVISGILKDDPSELLEAPTVGEHLPEVLSTEEIDRMEAAIDLSKWEGQRNRAIIEVLFSCGLRVSELVNLKFNDIFEREKFLRIIGKGDKERLVPISDSALHEIQLWLYDRNLMKIKPGEQDYVFLNRRGAHLTRTMILIMIKRTAEEAGITKTVSPHTLRHSFATELLKGGADLRAIQEMLGHENIKTTQIYTHIDITTLRKEILTHHPRNIKENTDKQLI